MKTNMTPGARDSAQTSRLSCERREMYIAALNAPTLRQIDRLKSEHRQAARENDTAAMGRLEQAISHCVCSLHAI